MQVKLHPHNDGSVTYAIKPETGGDFEQITKLLSDQRVKITRTKSDDPRYRRSVPKTKEKFRRLKCATCGRVCIGKIGLAKHKCTRDGNKPPLAAEPKPAPISAEYDSGDRFNNAVPTKE